MATKNFNFSKTARGSVGATMSQAQSTILNMLGAAEAQYQLLPLDLIDPSPLQSQFYSVNEEKMDALTDSIRLKGVLQPIVVRTKPNGRFEILAGHCRVEGSRRAGKATIPAMVYIGLDDASAEYIFHVTNLENGHDLPPSERAKGYAAIAEMLASKGLPNNKSTAGVAQETGVDVRTVQRYNRLASLNQDLLRKVDEGSISVRAGAQLSYLDKKQQIKVLREVEKSGAGVSEEQAKALRRKAEKKEPLPGLRKLDFAPFSRFFEPTATKKEVEARIVEALAFWEEHHE